MRTFPRPRLLIVLACLVAATLPSCRKPYMSPARPPLFSSTLRIGAKLPMTAGAHLELDIFDFGRGCPRGILRRTRSEYAGTVNLPARVVYTLHVPAGVALNLFFRYSDRVGFRCNSIVGFVPEAGRTYDFFYTNDMIRCTLGVRDAASGEGVQLGPIPFCSQPRTPRRGA